MIGWNSSFFHWEQLNEAEEDNAQCAMSTSSTEVLRQANFGVSTFTHTDNLAKMADPTPKQANNAGQNPFVPNSSQEHEIVHSATGLALVRVTPYAEHYFPAFDRENDDATPPQRLPKPYSPCGSQATDRASPSDVFQEEAVHLPADLHALHPDQDATTVSPIIGCYDYNLLHPLTHSTVPTDAAPAECPSDPDTAMRLWRPGVYWPYCTLCDKWSDDSHLTSTKHLRRKSAQQPDAHRHEVLKDWQDGTKHFRDRWCTLCKQWSSDDHLLSKKHLKKAALQRTDSSASCSKKTGIRAPLDDESYMNEEFWPPAPAYRDTHRTSAWSSYHSCSYGSWNVDSWFDNSWATTRTDDIDGSWYNSWCDDFWLQSNGSG